MSQLTDEELNALIRRATRRSRSSQRRKEAVMAARAGHRASAADSYFRGVKPKCTQGRHYSVKVADSGHSLVIQETATEEKCPPFKIALPCFDSEGCVPPSGWYDRLFKWWRKSKPEIPLPCPAHTRIIGRPIVIGCRGNIMVLQYLSNNCPHVRFLLVNTETGTAQCVEDTERYFRPQFITICPIECLISPDFRKVLFRLPQPIMNTRSWSKMLSCDISYDSEYNCHVSDIKADDLLDKQNQAVVFDPRHPCCVTFLMVDEYCTTCQLHMYDINTKTTLLKDSCRLSRYKQTPTDGGGDVGHDSGSDSESVDRYRFLLKCYVDYSKSGDVIVLSCIVKDGGLLSRKLYSYLYFFNSDTLQLMHTATTEIPVEIFSHRGLFDARKYWFGLMFNDTDTVVSVSFVEYGTCVENSPIQIVSLPKRHQLKSMCRQVILQTCDGSSLENLPLPNPLIDFLRFQKTFYVI